MAASSGNLSDASNDSSEAGNAPGGNRQGALVKRGFAEEKFYLEPTPVHPALKEAPNVWLLLRALRHRLLPALLVGTILGGAVGAILWMVLPPGKHMARSLLHMAAVEPFFLLPQKDGYSFEMYQRSQVALIKSRFVLNKALQQPEAKKLSLVEEQTDPVQRLEKELKADFSLGPETLRISLEGKNQQEIRIIVDAVTKTYLDEIVNKEHNKKLTRLEKLKDLYRKYEERIQLKKQTLWDLAKAVGINNAQSHAQQQLYILAEWNSAKTELLGVQSDLRKLEAQMTGQLQEPMESGPEEQAILYGCFGPQPAVHLVLAALLKSTQKEMADAVSPKVIEENLNQDLVIQRYLKQVKSLEDGIRAFERVLPTGASQVPVLNKRKELEAVRQAIKDRRKELVPQVIEESYAKARLESRVSLMKLRHQQMFFKRHEQILKGDIAQLEKKKTSLIENNIGQEQLDYEIKGADATLSRIAREIDALEVEKFAPARITLLEDAVNYPPDGMKRQLMMMGLGGGGSFFLVLLGFAWLEFRSRKVNSPEEVVHGLGINLIGTLPDFAYRTRNSRWLPGREANANWDDLLTDSVDAIRTMLLFTARAENIKVVMVTSATAGEGKTFSASHLAASLARAGRRTLLIDCDLRNANAHRLFDLPRAPGFSEILRGEKETAEAIHPTQLEGLSVLPAGQADFRAIQALAQDKVGAVFEQLRKQFDFLVIDSSPVLPVPDALVLAQNTDAVIFSILRGVSRIPQVYSAYQRLSLLGIRVLGALVNGARDDAYTKYMYPYPVQQKS